MTLTEFLSTANADNQIAYEEKQALPPVKKLVKINGAARKTAVESINIFNDTEIRLRTFTPNPEMNGDMQKLASKLARMILKAFENLFEGEFYINLEDEQVAGAWSAAVTLGVLTETEFNGILAAGTEISEPLKHFTLQDIIDDRDVGNTVYFAANSAQHQPVITIDKQPIKPVNIALEHRFGPDVDNLTQWHNCGTILNVFYTADTEQTYTATVPAVPATVREVRAKSPVSLGMKKA
jgi:hypothetical protein